VSVGDGSPEDILTYNQILAHLEKQHQDDIKRELHGEKFWTFKEILDHCRVEGQLMVFVKWEDNSYTWEPLNIIGKGDPVTIADYAKRNDLIETPEKKRFRRYAKKEKKINCLLNQLHVSAMRHRPGKETSLVLRFHMTLKMLNVLIMRIELRYGEMPVL
jgi:hypothetical protein